MKWNQNLILEKLFSTAKRLSDYEKNNGKPIFYRAAGGRHINEITDYTTNTSAEKNIKVDYTKQIGLCLSSTIFWFYQQVFTDGLNLKSAEIKSFPLPDFSKLNKGTLKEMSELYQRYLVDMEAKANIRTTSGESTYNVDSFKEYKIVRSISIIDEIDNYICPLYGLTPVETDFVKD